MPAMSQTSHHNHRLCGIDAIDQFDTLIDVRTPAEFAADHIPGAINAPVLSNDERVTIGTIYKQESAFKATRLGAALVARNMASHIDILFADKPRKWKPMIYCWRGGKRSASVTDWFNLIGWRTRQLEGGYKAWRRHVITQLNSRPPQFDFIILAGPTGSGKTRLLNALASVGAQTLDLEGIARHRGSLLGAFPDADQPSQKAFETQLFDVLRQLTPDKPVFIEAESRRIGHIDLPSTLLKCMHQSRCVNVNVALADRIHFLLEDYQHLFSAPTDFKAKLTSLTRLHSRKTITAWHHFIDTDQRAALFTQLVETHYDPAYYRSSHGNYVQLNQASNFQYDPTIDDNGKQAMALLAQLEVV